ncbi:MAG: hypothetical protein ABJC62_03850 [Frankiaceae bacterium]
MRTFRQVYHTHGRVKTNFNTAEISDRSVVLVTACEITTVGSNPHHRFLGDANVWVSNIAPHGPPSHLKAELARSSDGRDYTAAGKREFVARVLAHAGIRLGR